MNFNSLFFVITTVLLAVFTVSSQVITLQQGSNGYNECTDSYIMHGDQDSSAEIKLNDLNFGDADSIITDLCKT